MEIPTIAGPPQTPPTPESTPTPPTEASPTVAPVAETVAPTTSAIPQRTGSILPSSILTKEDKKKLLESKKSEQKRIQLIKKITVTFFIISLGWFFWVQMNLNENNPILTIFGINENLGQKKTNLQTRKDNLTLENSKITNNIEKLEEQLEDKNYTRYSKELRDIRAQQLQWYDEIDADGELLLGLTNAVPHMQDFFNDRDYVDTEEILSGKHGDIQIKNLQVSRDGINFSVDGSQMLGKVFFLNIEFIEMVNSFPFLKNGKLAQFARQKNEDDDDSMNFSVRLELQNPKEIDPADERFPEFLTWLTSDADIDSDVDANSIINE
jgi:hypothetical protein